MTIALQGSCFHGFIPWSTLFGLVHLSLSFNTFNAKYLLKSIIIRTFACVIKTFNDMKKYKVKDVLQMLKKDGWYLARTKGDHRQFKHPSKPGTVTIGLTHRDISTSIHGQYNYGIMGLSFRPGDACVVSTFRLKRKDDLWKVTIHEFLHSRGLPHCKKNAPKCLMQDAHGKNTFYMKHGLCEDCKNSLRMIMTHQER